MAFDTQQVAQFSLSLVAQFSTVIATFFIIHPRLRNLDTYIVRLPASNLRGVRLVLFHNTRSPIPVD